MSGQWSEDACDRSLSIRAYTYTSDGRLSTAKFGSTTATYTWNAIGNVSSVKIGTASPSTLVYDSGNRLKRTVAGSVVTTYSWDASRGLRTFRDAPGTTSDARYVYDGASHLTRVVTTGSVTATMTYDAAGQRMRSLITSGATTTDTSYRYEGITLHALNATSTSSTGSVTATWSISYLRDGSGDLYGAVYTASDATATPMLLGCVTTDRGDVAELTDEAGTVIARYDYNAWGTPSSVISTPTALIPRTTAQRICERQPLRYAGYCYDAPTRLYYLSQRYYDPATMQFLTRDPADADGEQSSYQYCGGDPVGKVDPSGEWSYHVRAYHKLSRSEVDKANKAHTGLTIGWVLVGGSGMILGGLPGVVLGAASLAGGLYHSLFNITLSPGDTVSLSTSSMIWFQGNSWLDGCHGNPQKSHYFYWRLRICRGGYLVRSAAGNTTFGWGVKTMSLRNSRGRVIRASKLWPAGRVVWN